MGPPHLGTTASSAADPRADAHTMRQIRTSGEHSPPRQRAAVCAPGWRVDGFRLDGSHANRPMDSLEWWGQWDDDIAPTGGDWAQRASIAAWGHEFRLVAPGDAGAGECSRSRQGRRAIRGWAGTLAQPAARGRRSLIPMSTDSGTRRRPMHRRTGRRAKHPLADPNPDRFRPRVRTCAPGGL